MSKQPRNAPAYLPAILTKKYTTPIVSSDDAPDENRHVKIPKAEPLMQSFGDLLKGFKLD